MRIPLFALLFAIACVRVVEAHLPYMVADTGVALVEKPEVSKAFYGECMADRRFITSLALTRSISTSISSFRTSPGY